MKFEKTQLIKILKSSVTSGKFEIQRKFNKSDTHAVGEKVITVDYLRNPNTFIPVVTKYYGEIFETSTSIERHDEYFLEMVIAFGDENIPNLILKKSKPLNFETFIHKISFINRMRSRFGIKKHIKTTTEICFSDTVAYIKIGITHFNLNVHEYNDIALYIIQLLIKQDDENIKRKNEYVINKINEILKDK
jgi:hypothetical protein